MSDQPPAQPTFPQASGGAPTPSRGPSHQGLWVAAGAAVVLAVIIGVVVFAMGEDDGPQAADEAEAADDESVQEAPAEPEQVDDDPADDEPVIDRDALAAQICDDLTTNPNPSPDARASFILRGEGVQGADLVMIRNEAQQSCPEAFEAQVSADLTPEDLELEVVVLEKRCFGSAGCNIGFRVELTYLGVAVPGPDDEYEVTYEIQGGESTYINTLRTEGDQYWVDERERISTASEDDELTAVVTRVSRR